MMNSKMHKTYRIASKFRFSMFIIVTVTIVIIGVYLISAQGVFGGQPQSYETVDVCSGDTVWSIAAEHVSDGEDIRAVVREIRRLNKLEHDVTIYAGEVIRIPAY